MPISRNDILAFYAKFKHSFLIFRVRNYDKKLIKPFLLREKILSKDDKLLRDFNIINELNINKMVKDNYGVPPSASSAQLNMNRNFSIGQFLSTSG